MPTPEQVTLADIRAAKERLAGIVVRTPLVRLDAPGAAGELWLKLENLQPIGSFKLRGAANAMLLAGRDRLASGVYTASAGNMAQGVGWAARHFGVPCTVVVPDTAPRTKVDAIERLGGRVVKVPYERWWQTLVEHSYPGIDGVFVHPVSDPAVVAGNGTIGLEIVEDLPDVDAVLVPFGGGGLSSGIATAVRALAPNATVFGCEVETATPLSSALAAGAPVRVARTPTFIDGIGGMGVLDEMWPLVSAVLHGALVSTVAEVADAIRLMAERARVVAEGAGGAALAAALRHRVEGKVVCVVSGGNIDTAKLATILEGRVPS
ncbi:MAG TPA: threonine/serine dehydratase [Gemmatimonadaceae bacterium]|nr:threonine/serine dehydratase [Gemmatimonadaceae bacterium]